MAMIIKRDYYLQQLISSKSNNLIKIVTGIRRSGKSFLLFHLFHKHLIETGVSEDHIIEIALDDRLNKNLRDPDVILQHIHERIVDDKLYYIILDEVQMIDEFTDVLNSLLHIRNADVYVTGSNSKFLSKDVVTEFRGRGDEIHLFPLSFAELYNSLGGEKLELWKSLWWTTWYIGVGWREEESCLPPFFTRDCVSQGHNREKQLEKQRGVYGIDACDGFMYRLSMQSQQVGKNIQKCKE